jgi:hypothetical protein
MWKGDERQIIVYNCAVYCIKCCIVSLLHGMWASLESDVCCCTCISSPSPLKPRRFLYVPPAVTLQNPTFSSHRLSVYFFMDFRTNSSCCLIGVLWLYNGDGVCLLRGTYLIFKLITP